MESKIKPNNNKAYRVKTQSGLVGWRQRLKAVYKRDFEAFASYCKYFGNHRRLGFDSPKQAWNANPVIEGSVNPSDYRRVA